jgi:hypothetical protein
VKAVAQVFGRRKRAADDRNPGYGKAGEGCPWLRAPLRSPKGRAAGPAKPHFGNRAYSRHSKCVIALTEVLASLPELLDPRATLMSLVPLQLKRSSASDARAETEATR